MFTGLCRLGIDPSWLLSSCLKSASLRSVRIPANRDVRLRYLEGNRRPKSCQVFFRKSAFLAHFSRYLLISKYLEPKRAVFRRLFVAQAVDRVEVGREVG